MGFDWIASPHFDSVFETAYSFWFPFSAFLKWLTAHLTRRGLGLIVNKGVHTRTNARSDRTELPKCLGLSSFITW